jgi:hypothetical protein
LCKGLWSKKKILLHQKLFSFDAIDADLGLLIALLAILSIKKLVLIIILLISIFLGWNIVLVVF